MSIEDKKSKCKSRNSVQVIVRVRPLLPKEIALNVKISLKLQQNSITMHLNDICKSNSPQFAYKSVNTKRFTFDQVFDSTVTQQALYNQALQPLMDSFLQGFNVTVMAYGQTGSGKTFTMGNQVSKAVQSLTFPNIPSEDDGLVARFLAEVYSRTRDESDRNQTQIYISFFEIYGEDVCDLLEPNRTLSDRRCTKELAAEKLHVREDKSGVYVQNLTEIKVDTCEEALELMRIGCLRRSTASTEMNEHSSRSHAVYTVKMQRRVRDACLATVENAETEETLIVSKLTFVDLAGSERLKKTLTDGIRRKEGIQINSGLFALGNVINALGDERRREPTQFVPYRASKLTRLLQDALGGNSRTLFIACISPADTSANETLSTLQYANRAKNIQNKAIINIDSRCVENLALRAFNQLLQRELVKVRLMPLETDLETLLKHEKVVETLRNLERLAQDASLKNSAMNEQCELFWAELIGNLGQTRQDSFKRRIGSGDDHSSASTCTCSSWVCSCASTAAGTSTVMSDTVKEPDWETASNALDVACCTLEIRRLHANHELQMHKVEEQIALATVRLEQSNIAFKSAAKLDNTQLETLRKHKTKCNEELERLRLKRDQVNKNLQSKLEQQTEQLEIRRQTLSQKHGQSASDENVLRLLWRASALKREFGASELCSALSENNKETLETLETSVAKHALPFDHLIRSFHVEQSAGRVVASNLVNCLHRLMGIEELEAAHIFSRDYLIDEETRPEMEDRDAYGELIRSFSSVLTLSNNGTLEFETFSEKQALQEEMAVAIRSLDCQSARSVILLLLKALFSQSRLCHSAFLAQEIEMPETKAQDKETQKLNEEIAERDRKLADLHLEVTLLRSQITNQKKHERVVEMMDQCRILYKELGMKETTQGADVSSFLLQRCQQELHDLESAKSQFSASLWRMYDNVKAYEEALQIPPAERIVAFEKLENVAGETLESQREYIAYREKKLKDAAILRLGQRLDCHCSIVNCFKALDIRSETDLIVFTELSVQVLKYKEIAKSELENCRQMLSHCTNDGDVAIFAAWLDPKALTEAEEILSVLTEEREKRTELIQMSWMEMRENIGELEISWEDYRIFGAKCVSERENSQFENALRLSFGYDAEERTCTATLKYLTTLKSNLTQVKDKRRDILLSILSTLQRAYEMIDERVQHGREELFALLQQSSFLECVRVLESEICCTPQMLLHGKSGLASLCEPVLQSIRVMLCGLDESLLSYGLETMDARICFILGRRDTSSMRASRAVLERHYLTSSLAEIERATDSEGYCLSALDPLSKDISFCSDTQQLNLLQHALNDHTCIASLRIDALGRLQSLEKIMQLRQQISVYREKLASFQAEASQKNRLFGSSTRLLEEEKYRRVAARKFPLLISEVEKEAEKWINCDAKDGAPYDIQTLSLEMQQFLQDCCNTNTMLMHLDLKLMETRRASFPRIASLPNPTHRHALPRARTASRTRIDI